MHSHPPTPNCMPYPIWSLPTPISPCPSVLRCLFRIYRATDTLNPPTPKYVNRHKNPRSPCEQGALSCRSYQLFDETIHWSYDDVSGHFISHKVDQSQQTLLSKKCSPNRALARQPPPNDFSSRFRSLSSKICGAPLFCDWSLNNAAASNSSLQIQPPFHPPPTHRKRPFCLFILPINR